MFCSQSHENKDRHVCWFCCFEVLLFSEPRFNNQAETLSSKSSIKIQRHAHIFVLERSSFLACQPQSNSVLALSGISLLSLYGCLSTRHHHYLDILLAHTYTLCQWCIASTHHYNVREVGVRGYGG